jgi:hypothetical protein
MTVVARVLVLGVLLTPAAALAQTKTPLADEKPRIELAAPLRKPAPTAKLPRIASARPLVRPHAMNAGPLQHHPIAL